jgi:hypothetical protein
MWLRPQGYAVITSPKESIANLDGVTKDRIYEGDSKYDTSTCGHCGRVTHIKPGMRPEDCGGLCKICMRLICPQCVGFSCDVIEKKLERAEARGIALRSYGYDI